MFTNQELEKYADVLIWALEKNRKLSEGDVVRVRFGRPAIALAEDLYEKLVDRGINVVLKSEGTPRLERALFTKGSMQQIEFVGPWEKTLYENLNGSIFISAPENLFHLKDVDPEKIMAASLSMKPLKDIINERENDGKFSWTLCCWPTRELAAEAKISIDEYKEKLMRACLLDRSDPVSQWEVLYNESQEIKNWLNEMLPDVYYFHIKSRKTDLKIYPGENRKFVGVDGCNIPSFELFLSPDCTRTEGVYFADQPSYRDGNIVKNIRIEFKNGKAVSAEAEEGNSYLQKMIDLDEGARMVGEFSLTDKRFSPIDTFMAETLFDENFGGDNGNCHIALGDSYDVTYTGDPNELSDKARKKELNFNDSVLHWDIINGEDKEVTAHFSDGRKAETIYQHGKFTLDF